MRTTIAITLALAIVALSGAAVAGDAQIGAGSKQLVFTFSAFTDEGAPSLNSFSFRIGVGDIGYSPFRGGLAFRYFITDDMAIRPGFFIRSLAVTIEPDTAAVVADADASDSEYGFSLTFEKYLSRSTGSHPTSGWPSHTAPASWRWPLIGRRPKWEAPGWLILLRSPGRRRTSSCWESAVSTTPSMR